MPFCDDQSRHTSALTTLSKAKWVRILGLVVALPILASSASSQGAPSPHGSPSAALVEPQQQPSLQTLGNISGTLFSHEGNPIVGAQVVLTRGNQSPEQQTVSDEVGNFSFANVPPGAFKLIVTAPPFVTQTYAGILAAGQTFYTQIAMVLPAVATTVVVIPPEVEAEHEVKAEEHQRVLGFVPNFYVTYAPNPVPLDFKQKLDLAWKSSTDPITVAGVASEAGVEQARNWFSAYGQGAQGYGKRFGAAYGDVFMGTFLGSAIAPAVLKQDPRYYYKGTGSWKSRLWYAFSRSVITKGDNGHWQPNYSNFLGNLAAEGIANAYRTPKDRSVGFTFETAGVRIAETAFANVFQEFFSRKLTPILSHRQKDRRKDGESASSRGSAWHIPGDIDAGNYPN